MNKSNNRSAFALLIMFSVLLIIQTVESKQLLSKGANGLVKAKATLDCITFIDHKDGETCFSTAQKFKLTLDEFNSINPNINCDKLFIGQWLCLEATTI